MVTDFPVYILSNTIVSVCILIWGLNSEPWDKVVNCFGACIAEFTPRVSPIMENIIPKILKRLWSCAVTINSSVSTLSPALLSLWWVSCKSTSAFWHRNGYWSCNGFYFQVVSIAFFPFSLAILFNFWAFSMFFISPSNWVLRSKSISHANSLDSFTTKCESFYFSCFKASCSIHASDKIKYRKKDRWCFIRQFELGQAPLIVTSWDVKTVNIALWVMHAVCCNHLSNFNN